MSELCECVMWARSNQGPLFTQHHPNCSKSNPEEEAALVIRNLLKGVEAWAAEEDGVFPECWEAYKRAKAFVGQFNWKEESEFR